METRLNPGALSVCTPPTSAGPGSRRLWSLQITPVTSAHGKGGHPDPALPQVRRQLLQGKRVGGTGWCRPCPLDRNQTARARGVPWDSQLPMRSWLVCTGALLGLSPCFAWAAAELKHTLHPCTQNH